MAHHTIDEVFQGIALAAEDAAAPNHMRSASYVGRRLFASPRHPARPVRPLEEPPAGGP